ncbi:DNA mismatch repair protein MutS [Schizophyllum commune]
MYSRPNTGRPTTGASRPYTGSNRPWTGQSTSGRPQTGTGRPWTGQTRPGTGRPGTAASNYVRHEASYIVAVLEGRGVAREVGMAALEKDTGQVVLVQISDCPTYVKTLHQMHLHRPALVLVPDTFVASADGQTTSGGKRVNSTSVLVEAIEDEFPGVPVEAVGRKYWNETSGLDFIQQLCVEDDERAGTLLAVVNKYYTLSAASALFKHAELKLNIRFSSGSLRIRYAPVEGTMMIDPETARNLELVGNMTHKKSTHTLFGTLNHTFTAMGARLLRTNILSPITVLPSIDARLDVVEEFVKTEDRFNEVKDALRVLNKMDFDKLIASLAASEARPTNNAKPASTRVTQMLSLRNAVKTLPLLYKALEGSQSQLLKIIRDMLGDERLTKIQELVDERLNEDSTPSKGGIAAVNARVYAVKANCNRLLDVARETYRENIGDIFHLNRTLSDAHTLPLALVYQESTGFVFTMKKDDLEGELPRGFLNVGLKKGKWVFTSMELVSGGRRRRIIQDMVAEIIVDVGALYKASEAVALLDMLWSFAHASIIRPEFTGTLAIKSGKHPILETIQLAGSVVPNDVYCDDSSCFQIVQGPNMSGKSTYLRQIALLLIVAMTGCFLLVVSSFIDDLKAFTTRCLATPKSLILLDELGRGTSPREGVGISHAIAEALVRLKAFVFFATHFGELTTTLSRQPSVVNLHLSVQRSRRTTTNFGVTFQYRIVDGAPEDDSHYGLELARLADLPEDVLTEAKRVASQLAALHARHEESSESNKIAIRRKALLRLRTQLIQAYEHSALPDQELLEYVARFQRDIAKAFVTVQ